MDQWNKRLNQPTSIAPLVVFRVLFGAIMLISVLRFGYMGWIDCSYVEPQYFFSYYGFDWLVIPGEMGIYALFALMVLSALMIMLGLFYQVASVLFFLSFSYVELLDKSLYLNHYYFVSLVSFLMIWLPAHRSFSLDILRKPALVRDSIPAWPIRILQLQLGMVYVLAGIAKLNPAWLLEAMPLRIWLPAQSHLPIIGSVLNEEWAAYVFSWAGALYDLSIVFFLLNRRTRPWAYAAVIGFHLMTALLFQIGMFPYIMMLATLIFFPPAFHQKLLDSTTAIFRRFGNNKSLQSPSGLYRFKWQRLLGGMLGLFFIIQLLLPFRYLLYSGNLFWTEQGYRFSWRVMLMEKAGYAVFHVSDGEKKEIALAADYLSPIQEKMMSTQPDMILQFAHYLEEVYKGKGFAQPEIRVESYVSLNGRRSQLLIDPHVNLLELEAGFHHKDWILPFDPELKNSRL